MTASPWRRTRKAAIVLRYARKSSLVIATSEGFGGERRASAWGQAGSALMCSPTGICSAIVSGRAMPTATDDTSVPSGRGRAGSPRPAVATPTPSSVDRTPTIRSALPGSTRAVTDTTSASSGLPRGHPWSEVRMRLRWRSVVGGPYPGTTQLWSGPVPEEIRRGGDGQQKRRPAGGSPHRACQGCVRRDVRRSAC